VVLYQDETTFYRQPTQAWLWSVLGRLQPRLPWSHRANTRLRVVGYLDAVTGAVHSVEMSVVSARKLAKSLAQLSGWYPAARTITLVWDNWPVHQHPTVVAALAAQPRLRVLMLPTYAPWLNAIEKLWRHIRQRVTHAHPWCDDFTEFRTQIRAELATFAHGSRDLVKYTGLSC
jgi:hypothetical protein